MWGQSRGGHPLPTMTKLNSAMTEPLHIFVFFSFYCLVALFPTSSSFGRWGPWRFVLRAEKIEIIAPKDISESSCIGLQRLQSNLWMKLSSEINCICKWGDWSLWEELYRGCKVSSAAAEAPGPMWMARMPQTSSRPNFIFGVACRNTLRLSRSKKQKTKLIRTDTSL